MDLPTKLTAQPEEVAKAVFKAVKRTKNTIYVKPMWWIIMVIIRLIPERLFKGLTI